MKSFLIIILASFLLSAGCDSTSSAASNQEANGAEKTNSETKYVPKEGSDYSDIEEIGDVKGTFRINGTINNSASLEGKYVKIYETQGKDIFLVDSAMIKGGAYTVTLDEAQLGFYKAGIYSFKLGEFIVNPDEKELSLLASGTAFDRGLRITGSKENDAYLAYKAELNKHEAELKKIRGMKASNDVKLKMIHEREDKFKVVQEASADKHPNTFFAKMVRRIQSSNRFDQSKYWDDVDFSDASLIRSMVLNDRIQDYMRTHGKGGKEGNDGFLDAVDFITMKAKEGGNDEVVNFMLYTMMEGFYTSGMTEASSYVIDNYIYGDDCGDTEISSILQNHAAGLKSLEIGKTPPDFTIEDENGKLVSLSKVASVNDLTLVVFWASWCHKCEQEMPVLKGIYDKYRAKGFEIIGVSVDMTKPAWQKGIKDKNCTWINVSQLEGWQSPVAKDYRVSSTPVMFLMDSKRELLLKPDRAYKLENWLKANFK